MISRFALQALTSLGIVLVAVMLTDGQPSYAEGDEGCHFLLHLRQPVEFTGPAGGYDFELYRPTKYGANIYLSNVYGDQPCNWHASTNQNWLDLSRTSGEIAGGDDTFFTVSVNDRARDLPRGVHKAEVVLKSSQGRQPKYPWKVEVIVHAETPCSLHISQGIYQARTLRGEVPPGFSVAILTNHGDAPCEWTAQSSRPWLSVSPTSGVVTPQQPGQIKITANDGVANLPPGDHNAVVHVQWVSTRAMDAEIAARLEVDASPCELYFAEGQVLRISGKAGSMDFSPTHQKYVLENRGGTPCYNWQANGVPDWLTIEDDSTIYDASQTDVQVLVNRQAASQLRPESYETTIRFGSGNVPASNGLAVGIDVNPLPCHLEIDQRELVFRIEPEGQLEGENQESIVIRNNWTNEDCSWRAESRRDWLVAEPSSGTLAGGGQSTVVARIVLNTEGFIRLRTGSHSENLAFAVVNGAADAPVPVTLDIPCEPKQPCAYLHTSHTKTAVNQPATISLTIYNPLDDHITANLVAQVPSGWQVQRENFAERCSGICNLTYPVAARQQEFIEIFATPNNAGNYVFEANVKWEVVEPDNPDPMNTQTPEPPPEPQNLRVDVEVIGLSPNSDAPAAPAVTLPPATIAPIPSPTPEPVAVANAVNPAGGAPPKVSGTTTNTVNGPGGSGGIPGWGLLVAAAATIALAAVVLMLVVRRGGRRRRSPVDSSPIDYDELARAIERERRNRQSGAT